MAARFDSSSFESYGAAEAAGMDITVPDASLLFSGDFSRAGPDLILTGSDGAKFVVTGYFETDAPPALLSPEGAMLMGDVVTSLAGPQYPGQYAQAGGGPQGNGDTTVSVDLDGQGQEHDPVSIAVLENIGTSADIAVMIGDHKDIVTTAPVVA